MSMLSDPLLSFILAIVACRSEMALLALSKVCLMLEFERSLLNFSPLTAMLFKWAVLLFRLAETSSEFERIPLIWLLCEATSWSIFFVVPSNVCNELAMLRKLRSTFLWKLGFMILLKADSDESILLINCSAFF